MMAVLVAHMGIRLDIRIQQLLPIRNEQGNTNPEISYYQFT